MSSNSKKVLIATFSKNCNFGGALQEYALFSFLNDFCHVECIHYHDELAESLSKPIRIGFIIKIRMMAVSFLKSVFQKKQKARKKQTRHSNLLSPMLLIKEATERLYIMCSDIFHYGERKKMIAAFFAFWQQFVKYTPGVRPEHLSDEQAVGKIFYGYDICVSGSDQIWNPVYHGVSPYYYLDFVPHGVKKISYASSFGNYKFNNSYANERIADYLTSFSSVSVRESYSVSQLKSNCNINAQAVLDPTLLITKDEWAARLDIKVSNRKPYVLVYCLGNRRKIYKFAKKIAKQLNMDLIIIGFSFIFDFSRKTSRIEYKSSIGPKDFIELFLGASFVVTNSFHGTAFSVNFNVPFFSVVSQTSERVRAFLETVNLSDRIVFDCEKCEYSDVDFTQANKILEDERDRSIRYLKEAVCDDD